MNGWKALVGCALLSLGLTLGGEAVAGGYYGPGQSYYDGRYINAAGDNMTGALTINGNTAWHAGNDGAGSGLDADTIDGIDSAAFAQVGAATNFTTAPTIAGNTVWHAGNDGAGSGLDADTVDGRHMSDACAAGYVRTGLHDCTLSGDPARYEIASTDTCYPVWAPNASATAIVINGLASAHAANVAQQSRWALITLYSDVGCTSRIRRLADASGAEEVVSGASLALAHDSNAMTVPLATTGGNVYLELTDDVGGGGRGWYEILGYRD